jgi:hypothetical protein
MWALLTLPEFQLRPQSDASELQTFLLKPALHQVLLRAVKIRKLKKGTYVTCDSGENATAQVGIDLTCSFTPDPRAK